MAEGMQQDSGIDEQPESHTSTAAASEQRLALAARLSDLAEQMPAAFWTTDRELRFTMITGAILDAIGFRPENAIGSTLAEVIESDGSNVAPVSEHRRALAGVPRSFQARFAGRVFQCRVEPLHDDQDEVVGTIGIAVDITERLDLEEALRHRLAIESLLASVSKDFVGLAPDEIDAGVDRALQQVGEFVRVDRAYVFQFSPDRSAVTNTHEWCREGVEPQIGNLQEVPVSATPWWMERLHGLETIHIPQVRDLPSEASGEREILEAQDIQSLLAMPLIAGGRLMGFLGFDSVRETKRWSSEDAALLRAIGEIIATALDRGRADRALRESEAVNRSLLDANPDIVFRFSRDGTHLTCHVSQSESQWLNQADLIGRQVRDAHSPGFAALCMKAIDEVLTTGTMHEYEYREPQERGDRHWEVRAAPCGPEEVLVIVRNVTRRKKTEAELRERDRFLSSLISNLPGYVYRCRNDQEWTMEYLTEGIQEMLGYDPQELTVARSISIGGLIHPEDRERVWEEVQHALREHRRFQVVYRICTAWGEYCWVWEQGNGVYGPDGTVEAIEGFVTDITERKRGEESLARSHRLLRLTLNEMDHRVRNNLAAIVALIDLTAKKHDSVASFSESMKGRIQAMGTVHAALSRNRWTETTLRDLVSTLMPSELDSTLKVEGPDVQVSPRQSAAIGMVLHELFANSLKYGALREPGGEVSVSWTLRDSATSQSDTVLDLLWRERCRTPIQPPVAAGLGTNLIHGVVRNELRGRAVLTYPPDGAEHRLLFTIHRQEPPDALAAADEPPSPSTSDPQLH